MRFSAMRYEKPLTQFAGYPGFSDILMRQDTLVFRFPNRFRCAGLARNLFVCPSSIKPPNPLGTMRNPIFILGIFLGLHLVSSPVCAQTKTDAHIHIGTTDTLYSEVYGRHRTFFVHTPSVTPDPDRPFPVLYVLDGDQFFISVVGMVDQMSRACGGTTLPPMIVVGIPHRNRIRELPPRPDSDQAHQLHTFFELELIPYVEQKYHASSFRTLYGHSLGGLFVIQTLLERHDLFDQYLAIDPSLWWDDRYLMQRCQSEWAQLDLSGKSLFLGIADTKPSGITFDSLAKMPDTGQEIAHPQALWAFQELVHSSPNGLHFQYEFYEGDTHSSCVAPSQLDGIRFLFDWYDGDQILQRISNPEGDGTQLLEELDNHYRYVSRKMRYPIFAPADKMIRFSRFLASHDLMDRALAILNLTARYYPDNPGVFQTIGWFYEMQNDDLNARAAYRQADDLRQIPSVGNQ